MQQRAGEQLGKLDIAEDPLEVANNEFMGILTCPVFNFLHLCSIGDRQGESGQIEISRKVCL